MLPSFPPTTLPTLEQKLNNEPIYATSFALKASDHAERIARKIETGMNRLDIFTFIHKEYST